MKIFAASLFAAVMVGHVALAQPVNDDPTGPQPTLPTEPLQIKTQSGQVYSFHVELPTTPQEQATGEMFRTNIPADTGMLFLWSPEQVSQMWMKNCPVPEDMVFLSKTGKIVAIAENTVPYSLTPVSSGVPVAATLELQGGLTAKYNINVGDQVIAKPFTGG